jgi:hypothetical protein
MTTRSSFKIYRCTSYPVKLSTGFEFNHSDAMLKLRKRHILLLLQVSLRSIIHNAGLKSLVSRSE